MSIIRVSNDSLPDDSMNSESIDQSRIAYLLETLQAHSPAMLDTFPISKIITAFDELPPEANYTCIPEPVTSTWETIAHDHGPEGFSLYQKVTMLTLMRDFQARTHIRNYTPATLACYAKSFSRIMDQIEDRKFTEYDRINDLLIKDLSLCRQKMFSVGAQLAEDHSGLPRNLLLKAGTAQAFRFLKTTLLTRHGFSNYYQIHTHLLELADFTPEGWDAAMKWLAEMLLINPDVKGVFGASWFFDPALKEISPRLEYLSNALLDRGAVRFYSHEDADSGALATSATRKRLHESGQYNPGIYFIIWPRRTALRWLAAERNKEAQS